VILYFMFRYLGTAITVGVRESKWGRPEWHLIGCKGMSGNGFAWGVVDWVDGMGRRQLR
jgi:hypothetical protein